ncbi:hypothetical protein Ga0074812_105159 [Parafrankia irregularis]|uniref:Uncharacterized protein n=1 Tax=Parafrankia irregularis TaxID=795642 RepID=A0A0S4QJK5_9ACTN|nr:MULTISPECIES: hypothetical protein [Parafrankia]MBE3205593.1 hypothetical protein [Parafrankia sp. CH37]CUU55508.1 hypothetical protein Ga0074812_105159 [Parafrankia irregularis]
MALNRRKPRAGAGVDSVLAALAVLAALVLLASCAGGKPDSEPAEPAEPAIGAAPKLLASSGLRLPVEDYLPTQDQLDRLSQANLTLIQRCMARFGVRYDVQPTPGGIYGPVSLTDRRYGITDAELARTAGYGLGARDPALQPKPARPDLDADGQTVLTGQGSSVVHGLAVPADGCLGEADRALVRSVPKPDDLRRGNNLQMGTFEVTKRDSRVRAVFVAWSACMKEAGYHYADPLVVAGDPAFTSPPSTTQIAVALADIACKARTNLVGEWFTVESAYQRRAIDADPTGFARTRAALAARDRTATEVAQ